MNRAFFAFTCIYLIILSVGLAMGLEFEWKVTLGDIALGVLGAIFSIVVGLYRFWLPRHPFTMGYYEKPWDTEDEENPPVEWKIIQCKPGEPQEFFIGVKLRTQRSFKTIDIRLVEHRWGLFWKEPPKNTAKVLAISDQERPFSFTIDREMVTTGKDNKKGGREASYEQIINGLPRGTTMWYKVTVSAKKDWNGWLSFQLRRGSSHKGIVRTKLCFKLTPERTS